LQYLVFVYRQVVLTGSSGSLPLLVYTAWMTTTGKSGSAAQSSEYTCDLGNLFTLINWLCWSCESLQVNRTSCKPAL